MVVAIAFGGSTVLVGEAAASALLVVTIQLPGTGLSGARFLDSLLGGIVAIAVTSLLPRNPVEAVHRAAAPLLAEIAGTLEDVARALERRDRELAERAWARSHGLRLADLDSAVAAGREMLRLAPFRGGTRQQFARYEQAAAQIRTALTSVEALSRGAVRALTVGDNVPAPVPDALRDLAETVRTLDEYLDDPAGRPVVREPALRAAAQATLVLEQTSNLSVSVIVAQVRSTAVDLIRGWGLAREEAERLVREAAHRLATGEHAVPGSLPARRLVDTATRAPCATSSPSATARAAACRTAPPRRPGSSSPGSATRSRSARSIRPGTGRDRLDLGDDPAGPDRADRAGSERGGHGRDARLPELDRLGRGWPVRGQVHAVRRRRTGRRRQRDVLRGRRALAPDDPHVQGRGAGLRAERVAVEQHRDRDNRGRGPERHDAADDAGAALHMRHGVPGRRDLAALDRVDRQHHAGLAHRLPRARQRRPRPELLGYTRSILYVPVGQTTGSTSWPWTRRATLGARDDIRDALASRG